MILLCGLPSATISGMFANEACSYRDEATTSILFSTILSLDTFSFAIYLIERGLGLAQPERILLHAMQHCALRCAKG